MKANMNKRYECNLSTEDSDKAVKELNEPTDNNERLSRIDQLRDAFINQDCGFELLRNDDEFILRFLRARKFDQERALKMLTNYHKQRDSWPEVFDKVKSPSLLKHVFDAGCVLGLEGKAVDGSSIVLARPGKVESPLMTDFIASVVLSFEKMLEEETMQINGITVLEDLSFIGFEMLRQIGPSLAKRFLGVMQDAMPIRIKSINMVNEPKVFDVIFMIMRPFMKEKMRKRVLVHGSSFEQIHKMIDPSLLPPIYGGTALEFDDATYESWRHKCFGNEEIL